MKNFKWYKNHGVTCGFACECGENVQIDIIYSNCPSPNKMADDSFNQEVVADINAQCSVCHVNYSIELYRDVSNGWVKIWNDKTATLLTDAAINITHIEQDQKNIEE